MNWDAEFSSDEYQHFWNLTEEESHLLLQEAPSEALSALLLYQKGQKCVEQDDWNRAIAYFAETLALRPLWHSVWTEQAALFLRTGEAEAAIESCDRALDITVDDAQTWSLRGAALLRLRRYEAAIESCDRAFVLDPQNDLVCRTLSELQSHLDQYPETVLGYNKTRALQPDGQIDKGDRRTALQGLGLYEAAITSYDELLVTEPQNYKLWYARGLVLRKLGRVRDAIASFQQALEIRPGFYPATRSKLFLLLTRGQRQRLPIAHRATLWNDLHNVLYFFTKAKLPAVVTIALVALVGTRSHSIALSVSVILLLIAIARDLLTEAQR